VNIIEGHLSSQGFSVAIIVSRFNSIITDKLLSAAINCLQRHGSEEKDISIAYCPGAFEIASTAKKMIEVKKIDAVVCLGCVVRGETPHFDYVSSSTAKSIADLALFSGTPVAFGVLTTETMEQAFDRAGGKSGNKGWDAALTAIEMVNLFKKISSLAD